MSAALVVATAPSALAVVAGLPLVVRAALTLHAAGMVDVAVFAGPQARRVSALLARRCPGVLCLGSPEGAEHLAWSDLVLVVAGDVLFDTTALEPLVAGVTSGTAQTNRHRGATAAGDVRVVMCPGTKVVPLLDELGRWTGLRAEALRRVGLVDVPVTAGPGLFLPLDRAHPPVALETALLDHQSRHTRATDGYLTWLIDRRLSRPLTRWLLNSPVTPSRITVASILLGLAGAAGLATGSYAGRVGGLLALVVSQVLDSVDGELARARLEQSPSGARLDLMGDYVVNLATFLGLGVGLARQGLAPAGQWAAGALLGGVVAAMVTVHLLFVRPALRQGGDLHWSGDGESLRGTGVGKMVERLASRDYTYLLLLCALAGRLEWFLYAAALGSWIFVAGLLGFHGYGTLVRRPPVVPW